MENAMIKSQLTMQQQMVVGSEFEKAKKSKAVLFLLWWFTGVFGGHRFYLGDTGRGVAILLLGWATLFLWPVLDVFVIGGRLRDVNERIEADIMSKVARASQ